MNQTTVALADLYKWTVSEFHQMAAAGIIEEDAHVELLHGQIVHSDGLKITAPVFDSLIFSKQATKRSLRENISESVEKTGAVISVFLHRSPVGKFHAACVSFLNDWLTQQLRSDFIIRVQDPIKMDDHSEPEPDIAVVKRRADFYASHLPGPDDIELLIEVADSSLQKDQEIKAPLYANFGIKEFWLIDLSKQALHHYTQPIRGTYQQRQTFALDDHFGHPLLGTVVVNDLFPWL